MIAIPLRLARPAAAFVAALPLTLGCGDGTGSTGEATARLRVVHTVVGVPALDVVVGDRIVIANVPFGSASAFVAVAVGSQPVVLRAAGSSGAVPATTLTFTTGDSVTVLAADSSGIITPRVLSDTGALVPPDRSKLRAVHAAAQAPALDVWRSQPDYADFVTIQFPFAYGATSPYLESDPGTWRVLVSTEWRDGGIPVLRDTLLLSAPIVVPAGASRTVMILDDGSGGVQLLTLSP